jgi:hypothetical protein
LPFSLEPVAITNWAIQFCRILRHLNVLCSSEKVKKAVKARDCYGLVFDRAKRNNAMKLHNAERGDLNLQHRAIQGIILNKCSFYPIACQDVRPKVLSFSACII